ncbi:MAG TPA: class I SAM-dependent methyltransferase [Gaiellaceae bacterium]|jgi:2-polyprenyl-3-methyl-5-hydroxy-6-metoxy-1,4-benzoquinol methylase|nr:class I SAM-dependent methyltransferase [Gaiellaceae bacterium]
MTSVKDPEGAEARALAELADFRSKRVLEIGCGDGRLTSLYARQAATVLGIDVDEELIAEARKSTPPDLSGRVRFEAVDVRDLDVPAAGFDLAFFSWSL